MNRNLLRAKVVENGMTLTQLAKELHLDEATLYRKINGNSDFYRKEIQMIKHILNLTIDDIRRIFFDDDVAEMRNESL